MKTTNKSPLAVVLCIDGEFCVNRRRFARPNLAFEYGRKIAHRVIFRF